MSERRAYHRVTAQHWLLKSEPESYSWQDLVGEKRTAWTGVRNFQARKHLAAMRVGDHALFYHSGADKAAIGIAKVVRTAYPDPTSDDARWLCVDIAPVRQLERPVTLADIKASPALGGVALLRQSRLSVVPLSAAEFAQIVEMEKAGA